MEGRQGRRLHGIWMSYPLERKVRWITIPTAAVVILSIAMAMLIVDYSMKGFGDLLMDNPRSLAFWLAMDAGSSSFQYYIGDRSPEDKEKYEMSCARTRSALKSLLFDYEKIGADRYGVTWSILNIYGNYTATRDASLETEEGAPDYLDRPYTIYRVQGYLATHTSRLEQVTVQSGNEWCKIQRLLFIIVLAVSILWGAAALLVVGWLNRSVQENIVRPMVEPAEDSRRMRENDFTGLDTCAEGSDEIASLVRALYTMKANTGGYIEAPMEKYRTEKQLDEVRLQMLKNQMNPHFLLSVLNMIVSTAQIEDADTTEKMVHALSRLFRYNLEPADSTVPLERELKAVQDYICLQQMRFGQRIRYGTDCKPNTMEVSVPSFILQPLVENAIVRGASPKGQGGGIYVCSWMEGRRLWMLMADTGRGTAQERLEEIRLALARGEGEATGVGVGNIYRRVHGAY